MTKRKKKANVDKNDNIAMQIAISKAFILAFRNHTDNMNSLSHAFKKELLILEELKQKHPEYFI